MKIKLETIIILLLLFIISSCSSGEDLEQLKEQKLIPFNGKITAYSKEKTEPINVTNEEWLKARNNAIERVENIILKNQYSKLSFSNFQLGSSIQGRLNNKIFQLDLYAIAPDFGLIVSKYGSQRNLILSSYIPYPAILYGNSVWMSGARDLHVNYNIATGELGSPTTLDKIGEDYPQFKNNPKVFYNIRKEYSKQFYKEYKDNKSSSTKVGDTYEFYGNQVLVVSDFLLQIK